MKRCKKCIYKKVSDTIEEVPNMFQTFFSERDLGRVTSRVVIYECPRCGYTQTFVHNPNEELDLPDKITFNDLPRGYQLSKDFGKLKKWLSPKINRL